MRFLEAAEATAYLLMAGEASWSIKQESNEVLYSLDDFHDASLWLTVPLLHHQSPLLNIGCRCLLVSLVVVVVVVSHPSLPLFTTSLLPLLQ